MIEFLIDQALKEAIDLHNRNQLDDAKSLYNKIIEHDKENSDAYHLLSLINLVEGKLDEAKQSVQQALAIAKANDGFIGDSPGGQLRGGDIARVHLQQIDQRLTEQSAWENRGPGGAGTGLAYFATGAGIILLIGYTLRQQRRREVPLELAEKSST